MSKRKGEAVPPSATESEVALSEVALAGPSVKVRRIVSGLLAAHFSALAIALSANLAPSFLHGEILPWFAPVHVTTAQDYVLLPLELTHAAKIDLPLVADVRLVGDDPLADTPQWRRIQLPEIPPFASSSANSQEQIVNWSSSRSRWPNLSRLIAWVAIEQPDSEVLPEFALQLLKYVGARESAIDLDSVDEIRLIQPHVLTYDDWIMLNREQGGLLEATLVGEVLYGAKVLRPARGELRLLPLQEPAMTSKPLSKPSTKQQGATAR